LITPALSALEIEEQRSYPNDGARQSLRILSTADIAVFEPIIEAFQAAQPDIAIDYDVASSAGVMAALLEGSTGYDLAISSAMDLQTKLANDGFTQPYFSDVTEALPNWANWRGEVFAFTQEPAVMVISEAAFKSVTIPKNREELIVLLRDNSDIFQGKIGTYDVRSSGLGYLFATQDSRNTESFWRLTEVMGRLDAKLFCCSGAMIEAVAAGDLALAYNVLGSYAQSRLVDTPGIKTVALDDFTSVMLRTAVIPRTTNKSALAGRMIDFLVTLNARPELSAQTGLPALALQGSQEATNQRPIRLGPGLLVFLDKMRRETFLRSWTSSIEQN
jgi:iron(III) transport system substrate-binding protein